MDDIYELMLLQQQKNEIVRITNCNEKTMQFGLELTPDNVNALIVSRKDSLRESQRVEFRGGILPDIIYAFCDSQYVNQDTYMETLVDLQELFYIFKNESEDKLTDYELIQFMKEQYEDVCFGDIEYLSSTCLERFTRAIRNGWKNQMQFKSRDEYTLREVEKDYNELSEETRWDFDLYKVKLEDED